MHEKRTSKQFELTRIGLCAVCKHVRRVAARSLFYLCSRAFDNPAFPKYPPLPVVDCDGFEQIERVDEG